MNINQINTTTLIGKLLITTLATLSTCSKYSHLTPDEIFYNIQNEIRTTYKLENISLVVKPIAGINGTTTLFEIKV
jgi:hypothetical protein